MSSDFDEGSFSSPIDPRFLASGDPKGGGPVSTDDGPVLRRALLALSTLGMAGVLAELLLLGHTEEPFQWVPVIGLALGFISAGLVVVIPCGTTLKIFRVLMVAFVLAGFLGINRHYAGNVEFELEMYPSRHGFELSREAITGATPALAPGTMVLFGLLGLTYCLRHPLLRRHPHSPSQPHIPR